MNGIEEIVRQNREIAADPSLREIIEGCGGYPVEDSGAPEGGHPAPIPCVNVPRANFVVDSDLYVIITPSDIYANSLLHVALRAGNTPHLIAEGKFILRKDEGEEICQILSLSGCGIVN